MSNLKETKVQWLPNPNHSEVLVSILPTTVKFGDLHVSDRFLLPTGLGSFMPAPPLGKAYPLVKISVETAAHQNQRYIVSVPPETEVYPDHRSQQDQPR